jgi:hypothetical protein
MVLSRTSRDPLIFHDFPMVLSRTLCNTMQIFATSCDIFATFSRPFRTTHDFPTLLLRDLQYFATFSHPFRATRDILPLSHGPFMDLLQLVTFHEFPTVLLCDSRHFTSFPRSFHTTCNISRNSHAPFSQQFVATLRKILTVLSRTSRETRDTLKILMVLSRDF